MDWSFFGWKRSKSDEVVPISPKVVMKRDFYEEIGTNLKKRYDEKLDEFRKKEEEQKEARLKETEERLAKARAAQKERDEIEKNRLEEKRRLNELIEIKQKPLLEKIGKSDFLPFLLGLQIYQDRLSLKKERWWRHRIHYVGKVLYDTQKGEVFYDLKINPFADESMPKYSIYIREDISGELVFKFVDEEYKDRSYSKCARGSSDEEYGEEGVLLKNADEKQMIRSLCEDLRFFDGTPSHHVFKNAVVEMENLSYDSENGIPTWESIRKIEDTPENRMKLKKSVCLVPRSLDENELPSFKV